MSEVVLNNVKPISLIMLVHQEVESIEKVIKEYHKEVVSKIPNSQFILCEDGSTDGTKEVLLKLKDEYNLTLDMKEGKRGYTNAMKDGFRLAKNPIIFFSDSDGQHDPHDFWSLYKALDNHDMAIGWKKNRKDARYRLLMTYVFNKLMALYFKVRVHDIDCGFRVFKKEISDFYLKQDWRLKHCVNAELTARAQWAGFKITEKPVSHFDREFGESRGLPVKKLPQIIFHILKELINVKKDLKRK